VVEYATEKIGIAGDLFLVSPLGLFRFKTTKEACNLFITKCRSLNTS
jgi:hypothetical protein